MRAAQGRCSDNVSQLRLHAVDSSLFARFANTKKAGAGETEELLREAVQWSCSREQFWEVVRIRSMEVLREASVLKRAGLLRVAVQGSRSDELVMEAAQENCLR